MIQHEIFDRGLLKQRWKRALASSSQDADFLLRLVSEDLEDRLATIKRNFNVAIDLGGHSDHLQNALIQAENVGEVYRMDVLCSSNQRQPSSLHR